jgi:hypothetical protein
VWSLLVAAAFAGTPGLQACCTGANAGACPTELPVAGPGTSYTPEGGASRILGVWKLSCDGVARFDKAATQVVSAIPSDGTVLTPMGSGAAQCFDAACKLPAALCVVHDGERARVVECATQRPADANGWATLPADDSRAVVVGGRVVKARTAYAGASSPATQATVFQAGAPPEVHRAATGASGAVDKSRLDLSVPSDPPDPCKAAAALYDESGKQVDAADEAAMQGDWQSAMGKYRAAISINQCNAFAWAAMGEALMTLDEPARARGALSVATRLMPTHFQAWTNLGRAEEALGRPAEAAAAYRKALEARPGYGPADEGLQRTKSR